MKGSFSAATMLRISFDTAQMIGSAFVEGLIQVAQKPGDTVQASSGWAGGFRESHANGKTILQFNVIRYERYLPKSALDEALEERYRAHQERLGSWPGRRFRAQIREEVIAELLPRALIKSKVVSAHIVLSASPSLVVHSQSPGAADLVTSFLHRCIDWETLGVVSRITKVRLSDRKLVHFLNQPGSFANIEPGDHFDLVDPADRAVTAKLRGISVESDECQELLSNGFWASALEMHLLEGKASVCSGVVNDKARVSRFSVADLIDKDQGFESEDARETADLLVCAIAFEGFWDALGLESTEES